MRDSRFLGRPATDCRRVRVVLRALTMPLLALLCALATLSPLAAAERAQQLEFGVEMARRGLWSEALFRFRRADLENPENARILNNLAVAHEAVGQFDEAMELYRRAVKLEPGNAELKRNYARFVEFYQGFRPRTEDAEGEAAAEGGKPEDTEVTKDSEPEADEKG